ncbi:unnamed protein product [Phytomonas sp. Hart1]|nr:unnamed protein product [Phytomonas sp. Hart1]|eukprot:CCW70385.1 unnamed protein product [Phytomonas sp. isolate Hart1]
MDEKDLRSLAELLSSDKFPQRVETASKLRESLSPASLLSAWRDPAQAEVLQSLLSEAQSVRNLDVLEVIGESLVKLLADQTSGLAFIALDSTLRVPQFIFNVIADEDLELTTLFRSAFVALLELAVPAAIAERLGEMMDGIFEKEKVLRLFDCDAADSAENARIYSYLSAHTRLIDSVISATSGAFEVGDPLLLVNNLMVCGIIGRHRPLPRALLDNIQDSLEAPEGDLLTHFVCRFCSIVLLQHEENAQGFADLWVPRAVRIAEASSDEGTLDAAFDLMGSAATTSTGWRVLMNYLPSDRLLRLLTSLSDSLRLSALRFLHTLLRSAWMEPAGVPSSLIKEAWKLRTVYDEGVRYEVWAVALAVIRRGVLSDSMPLLYAAFLSGVHSEISAEVRELQQMAARELLNDATLPEPMKLSLVQFNRRGLYPPGSAGVANLRKD